MKKELWIKCDTPKCDYIRYMDSMSEMESFINRQCPHCKQVVLTENDFKTFRTMRKILLPFNWLVKVISFVFRLKPKKVDTQLKDNRLNIKDHE